MKIPTQFPQTVPAEEVKLCPIEGTLCLTQGNEHIEQISEGSCGLPWEPCGRGRVAAIHLQTLQ